MIEEENNYVEKFNVINESNKPKESKNLEDKESKKEKGCYFPSAYTMLFAIEFIIFILTYIIPKGKFNTIEYDSDNKIFLVNAYNKTATPTIIKYNATQETLDSLGVKIELDNFILGYIKKPIAIPNSYTKLEDEENANFFDLFTFPIYGMIDSSNVGFVLMMIGGCINLLVEMESLTSGMEALSRLTKGHELILLISMFILVSIGGTTFGMCEEILSFYPVLMPIFLKSGLDPALAAGSLYFGSIIGTIFSTVNAFAVVIGSYSAGINFIDGIVFRVIGFILADALTIGFFIFYHIRVKAVPERSAVYDIKEEIMDTFLKKKEDSTDENSNKLSDEEEQLKESSNSNVKPSKFTIIQKISLILFGCSFILLIIGVVALNWWFEQISAIFMILGIILIFFIWKGETKGIQLFTKGAGDFVGVILIIGIARGINLTLDKGLISDTILNGLSNLVDGLPKVLFAVIMFIIFIILGLFIQSSSGLAVLSMPIFAPLADKVNCSRKVVVNTYMFGQNFISFLSPTGLTLIVLQLVGMKYTHWIKFIWLFVVVLFVFLLIMIIFDSIIE